MIYKIRTKLMILLIIISRLSFAEQVPEGFEDLVESRVETVKVILNDDTFIKLKGEISSESFRLLKGQKEDITDFLTQAYVNVDTNKLLQNELSKGVKSSSYCTGRRETCNLTVEGIDDIQYVIIDNESAIRIFVPTRYLSEIMPENRYIETESEQKSAIIMDHGLNMSSYYNGELDYSYSNDFIAGFYGGYFSGDITYNNSDNDSFMSDSVAYNYLNNNHRVSVGYHSGYSEKVWNSTRLLDTSENVEVISFDFGNTSELKYRNSNLSKRLYFSSPSSGRLEVKRDDGKTLLVKNISTGQNYITYSELPRGIYGIDLMIKSAGKVVFQEKYNIYNNSDSNSMSPGDIDYLISVGKYLDDGHDHDSNEKKNSNKGANYVDGKLVTKLTDELSIGFGNTSTEKDYMLKTGLAYQDSDVQFSVLFGSFDDASSLFQSKLSVFDLSLEYEHFDPKEKNSLAEYLYGKEKYNQWSLNYNKKLWQGMFFASISNNDSFVDEEDEFIYRSQSAKYSNYTLGYSFPSYFNSTISANLNYMNVEDDSGYSDDETSFDLTLSIPIGVSSYSNSTFRTSDSVGEYIRSAVGNHYIINDEVTASVEVGASYEEQNDDENYDLSGSVTYQNNNMNGSLYGYVGSNGEFDVSGDLSSTTIYSQGKFFATNKKADSYLVINNGGLGANEISSDGSDFVSVARLKRNNDRSDRIFVDNNTVIEPLTRYHEYEVILDEEASDYHNLGDASAKGTSLPGTVVDLNINMRRVRSYISVFSDIEGNPIEDVSCRGLGCLSVEELTAGVFKFRVSEGVPFELFASNERCLIPDPGSFAESNLGYNFCMPSFELLEGLQVVKTTNGKFLYYVGEFKDDALIAKYENGLDSNKITFVKKQVGDSTYLFVSTGTMLAKNAKDRIEELSAYALEELNNAPYVSR